MLNLNIVFLFLTTAFFHVDVSQEAWLKPSSDKTFAPSVLLGEPDSHRQVNFLQSFSSCYSKVSTIVILQKIYNYKIGSDLKGKCRGKGK